MSILRSLPNSNDILVGDVVLLEVLRGARDERHATTIENDLRRFRCEPMLSRSTAVAAARHYRSMRGSGLTVAKATDLIIATFCVENDHWLLHDDRDFTAMSRHIGLKILAAPDDMHESRRR